MIENLVTPAYLKRKFPNNPAMCEVIDYINKTVYYLHQEYLNAGANPEGEYKWKRNIVDLDVKMVSALGHGHEMHGNLSTILGNYGNITRSYRETVIGSFAKDPQNQNPTMWIPTDLLLTLGNGPDKDHRSNVFEIYKNGLFKLFYALVLGAYPALPEGQTPKPGSLQYTTEKGFEKWNDVLKIWEPFGGNTTNIINNTYIHTTVINDYDTTVIYVEQTPAPGSARVFRNGARLHPSEYTSNGIAVTLNPAIPLAPGEKIQIKYIAWKTGETISEIPDGDIDGVNKEFTLSKFAEPQSLEVYRTGILQDETQVTLQGDTITFTDAPYPGEWLLVYFKTLPDNGNQFNISPAGAVDGVNKDFTIPFDPSSGILKVYLIGIIQLPEIHYSVAGSTITFAEAPYPGQWIIIDFETSNS